MRKVIVLEFLSLDGVIQAGGAPEDTSKGSANLVQTLMRHDVVDKFWLKIYRLTLGNGKRLFADDTIPNAFKVDGKSGLPKWHHYCELRACRRGYNRKFLILRQYQRDRGVLRLSYNHQGEES